MRWLLMALVTILSAHTGLAQQELIPERRAVVSRNVDFYGSDLQNLFDTTFKACQNACLSNTSCKAFTFNSRSNACFPKSEISDRQPYEGAISAEIITADSDLNLLAATRASDLGFLQPYDLENAYRLAVKIGQLHPEGARSTVGLLKAAQDRLANKDTLNAMRWIGGALSQTDKSDLWAEYARLNQKLATTKSKTKNTFRNRAFLASINAYLRATSNPERIASLMAMAEALEATRKGRQMLSALRLAEAIQPRHDVVSALDKAIGKYGFRITEHRVESDAASPRICAEFSEALVKSGTDYTTYVHLPDQRLAVQAEGNQICIDGVAHGARYPITFRKGLPSASGESLVRDVDLTLYVRDRAPSLRFPGRTYVLPRTLDAGLPIETVNLDQVTLRLQRVSDRNLLRSIQNSYFGKPLSYYELQEFNQDVAETLWTGTGDVQNTLNSDMTTRLPVGDVIADLPPGIYALTADLPGADPYDDTSATQWFVLSDLGVTTLSGTDGLHVFVRSLRTATAKEGTKVTLLSRANRVLDTVTTDAEGYAQFQAGLTRGTGAAAPALVMLENRDDLSFLSLTDPAFDLSDRGVEGRPPAPPIDVFLATDRGAYRAGETIHVTALARGDIAQSLPGLPITAILSRPDGVEYSRHLSTNDAAGGHVFTLPLGTTVPRGAWKIALKSDLDAPALATRSVLVEDFLPERIDFDLSLPTAPIHPSDHPLLRVTARYLFGAPGADMRVEGETTLRPRDTVDGFAGYTFGRHDQRQSPRTEYFGSAKTNADGHAIIALDLPTIEDQGRPLQADITVRVIEGSGRPVERKLTHPVAPAGPMIGIKPTFKDVVPEGAEARFQIVTIEPDLSPKPMSVRWTINRVQTRYQWYQLYGNWEWEPTTTRTRIATGDATISTTPLSVSAPVDWGQYEIVVERLDGPYVASSTDFYAGWYAPADASETPDTLALSLDKPRYLSGDTATLRIVPRFAGTALVSVMSNRLISMKAVKVSKGENLISLDVTDEWGAGAYVTASVIRPTDEPTGRNPARAMGLQYASIDPADKQLAVSLLSPEKVAPGETMTVNITVSGTASGSPAYVSLAAVDVGILNLTRFQSPNPSDHYFGQRRLGMEIRDIYGRLIDGMNGNLGALRSGGDAAANGQFQSPPPTEDLVAFFAGPVEVGPDGTAQVSFDLPDFNGTVRLMAIAWSAAAVGQSERDVLVRNPVVVTASLPRFLAPKDSSRMLLEIVHAEGPVGRMGLDITANGLFLDPNSIPSGIDLTEKGTVRLSVPITAKDTGDHSIRIALTTPDGTQLIKHLALPVRSNDPEISTTQRITLAAGDTFTLDTNLFADMRAGTGSAVISAGALAKFDVPGLMRALDRYPYGCTEQITSKAMPLLYFDTVAEALDLGAPDKIRTRIDQSIARILTRQDSNGAFGLWRANSEDFWLDAYVSDFLSRARAKGFSVPDLAFRQAMDSLRNRLNYAPDFDNGGQAVAYALMVLAREGAAAMGDLRYYADAKADDFATPLSLAHLGAALAFYGDQTRADRMFLKAASMLRRQKTSQNPIWRTDYGTNLRDTAAVLSLAVEAGSDAIDRSALTQRISNSTRALSTQESAWSLMAAHALLTSPDISPLSVNGTKLRAPLVRVLSDATLRQPVAIRNESTAPTDLTLTSVGVPTYNIAAGGYGYAITRDYFTMDGSPVKSTSVKTGDRLVSVLRISPFEKSGARLMINDPLPAGFEIDNPNLLSSGDVKGLDWLKLKSAEHTEFRSDRFLAAVDWRSDKPFQLAYVVRAVSPGQFHHPAATVEDMYRPQYRARTASGRLNVTP